MLDINDDLCLIDPNDPFNIYKTNEQHVCTKKGTLKHLFYAIHILWSFHRCIQNIHG